MKKLNILVTAGIIAIMMSGCTSEFEEINTNPNKSPVGQIQASSMFEPLLYSGANAWLQYTWYWNNELIQFTAFTGGTTRQEHRYFISDGNWQSAWNLYARYANNANHMYDLAVAQGDKSLEAIATTLKVLYMSNLTDMFGDIPYSEAFTSTDDIIISKPKFDSQRAVYEQMFAELEIANEIYASDPVFGKPSLDGMYGGSMEKWQKFNNSLYLRLLCRISGRSEMYVGTKMTEIINNPADYPVFTSNNDNATVNFSGSDPYVNEFAIYTEGNFTSSGRKLTQQLIKMTVITESGSQVYQDPRLAIIGKKNTNVTTNPSNKWIGTVAGCTAEEQTIVDRGTSWLNAAVFCRANAPGCFMDYAEVQFILAEAALKGYITGGEAAAKNYYTAAVTASMQKWAPFGAFSAIPVTITDTDITTFLASSLGSWDLATNKEELLGNQKYLALFWIGMEAYHEYRRTGYPVLTIGGGTEFNLYILPTRFAYPPSSVATNSNNTIDAIKNMGGETIESNTMRLPLWWSKQAIAEGK